MPEVMLEKVRQSEVLAADYRERRQGEVMLEKVRQSEVLAADCRGRRQGAGGGEGGG